MSTEGGIYIYRDEDIRKYPGDGDIDRMLTCISCHYHHRLNGVEYHTFYYYSENMFDYDPFDLNCWNYRRAENKGIPKEELMRFVDWLRCCPRVDWVVWA